MSSRFEYVAFDENAREKLALFKASIERLENEIESQLKGSRPQSLALTKLEEVYMWIGKAIRDEQLGT